MPEWSKDKIIGKKRYRYFGGVLLGTWGQAYKEAEKWRAKGYSAYVLRVKTEGKRLMYGIWVRKK